MKPLEPGSSGSKRTSIQIKVIPRSSKNEIIRVSEGRYRIKLTAPPVEGKANKALIQFLSKKTGLPKRDIEIISGAHSKNKIVSLPLKFPGGLFTPLRDLKN